MKHPNWRTTATLALVIMFVASLAQAKINKERGNIVSTDWRKMEIEIKNPRGRMKTWKVARDCKVTFTDKKAHAMSMNMGGNDKTVVSFVMTAT